MFRIASRSILRRQTSSIAFRPSQLLLLKSSAPRRTLFSSAKPTLGHRFRSLIARWGLAGALVYLYNTSDYFADSLTDKQPTISHRPPVQIIEEERLPSIDDVREKSKRKAKTAESTIDSQSVGELEEEAEGQGAFNEETGEINWDCPCLGGMAHGPCGPEFREAFSCFIFSQEEPKGIECVDRFKGMQDCFRKHPDVYGSPEGDEDDEGEEEDEHIDKELVQAIEARDGKSAKSTTGSTTEEIKRATVATADRVKETAGEIKDSMKEATTGGSSSHVKSRKQ